MKNKIKKKIEMINKTMKFDDEKKNKIKYLILNILFIYIIVLFIY